MQGQEFVLEQTESFFLPSSYALGCVTQNEMSSQLMTVRSWDVWLTEQEITSVLTGD